ncbi:MAG: hypothetical protein ABIU05_04220 [Nitrospirales bacterium]
MVLYAFIGRATPADGELHRSLHGAEIAHALEDFEAAKKRAEPYTKIVGELPEMRRETVELARKAVAENRRAYVLVNNRSEGNAPLTVQALTERLSKEVHNN